MRFEQIIAAVARIVAVVDVRTKFGVVSFASAENLLSWPTCGHQQRMPLGMSSYLSHLGCYLDHLDSKPGQVDSEPGRVGRREQSCRPAMLATACLPAATAAA